MMTITHLPLSFKIRVFKNIQHLDKLWTVLFHSGLWLGFSASPCALLRMNKATMTVRIVTINYPIATMHRSLLLDKDVDVLDCIHSEQTFAGAKLYNIFNSACFVNRYQPERQKATSSPISTPTQLISWIFHMNLSYPAAAVIPRVFGVNLFCIGVKWS